MFALRGIDVSFSVFVIVYCALSLAVCLTSRRIDGWLRQQHPQCHAADLLFGLRMFPLAAATVITAAFTIPSFLLLEPRAIQEPVGDASVLLGTLGAALGIFGLANAVISVVRARQTVAHWTASAEPAQAVANIPVLRIRPPVPAITATGILQTQILISGAAQSMLTAGELQTALHHELAHGRRCDNLKKLLLRFVAFPGMRGLESAWLEATEMAADDAAVSSQAEALDLAAALIKLSRLPAVESPLSLTAALVHSPASSMNARVERLIAWTEPRVSPRTLSFRYALGLALLTLTMFGVIYGQLLSDVHTATEWLIR